MFSLKILKKLSNKFTIIVNSYYFLFTLVIICMFTVVFAMNPKNSK